jgi:hypothetical protein
MDIGHGHGHELANIFAKAIITLSNGLIFITFVFEMEMKNWKRNETTRREIPTSVFFASTRTEYLIRNEAERNEKVGPFVSLKQETRN